MSEIKDNDEIYQLNNKKIFTKQLKENLIECIMYIMVDI